MSTVMDEERLLKATGNKSICNSLYIFLLELEAYKGINSTMLVNDLVSQLAKIREKHGGKLPPKKETYRLLDPILDSYLEYKPRHMNIRYIMYQDKYVIYVEPGQFMLTSKKDQASRFPSPEAAERFARELWIDGEIVK